MNRRNVLKALVGIVPLGAAVRLEGGVSQGDLIVIECPGFISAEQVDRLTRQWQGGWQAPSVSPRLLIVDGGMKVSVHRGVARVVTETVKGRA